MECVAAVCDELGPAFPDVAPAAAHAAPTHSVPVILRHFALMLSTLRRSPFPRCACSGHLRFGTGAGHTASEYDQPVLNVWGAELADVPAEILNGDWVFEVRQATLRVRGLRMAFVDLSSRSLMSVNAGDVPRPLTDFSPAAFARRRQAAAAAPARAPPASAAGATSAAGAVPAASPAPAAPPAAPPSQRGAAAVPPVLIHRRSPPLPRPGVTIDEQEAIILSPPSIARSSRPQLTPPEEPGRDADA